MPGVGKGTRWYCPVCHCKYKSKYGILLEVEDFWTLGADCLYATAEFLPHEPRQVRDLSYCKVVNFGEAVPTKSGDQPQLMRMNQSSFLTKLAEGTFMMDMNVYNELPDIEWGHLDKWVLESMECID